MEVVVFYNLLARDNRGCLEVRKATELYNDYYAGPKATIYSCAYSNGGKDYALVLAKEFCNQESHKVVYCHDCEYNRLASWQ